MIIIVKVRFIVRALVNLTARQSVVKVLFCFKFSYLFFNCWYFIFSEINQDSCFLILLLEFLEMYVQLIKVICLFFILVKRFPIVPHQSLITDSLDLCLIEFIHFEKRWCLKAADNCCLRFLKGCSFLYGNWRWTLPRFFWNRGKCRQVILSYSSMWFC